MSREKFNYRMSKFTKILRDFYNFYFRPRNLFCTIIGENGSTLFRYVWISSQHSICGHREQILLFLEACDQRVCALFGLLIFVSDPISPFRMACHVVNIEQDFSRNCHFACGVVSLVYQIAIPY